MNETNNEMNVTENKQVTAPARKVRSNSSWNKLNVKQRARVEVWLFEENRSYEDTAKRVKEEFGLETSLWSVMRFYRQRAAVRQSMDLIEAQVVSDDLAALPANTGDIRSAALKLLAKKGLRLAIDRPDDLEQLLPVTRQLLESEANEIRLRRVKLEERYLDYKAAKDGGDDLKMVRAYVKAVGENEYLSEAQKLKRVRDMLFEQGKVSVREAESPVADLSGEHEEDK